MAFRPVLLAVPLVLVAGSAPFAGADATTLWSHGDPTDEEQLFLELMNRARLDPAAEADRVFADYGDPTVASAVDFFLGRRPGVEFSRAENRAAFQSYAARPPFAFHAALIAAARKHTQLAVVHDGQEHQYPGELALRPRIEAEGYFGGTLGESVFSYAKNMVHAHAGFSIDWGQAVRDGESRPFLGHRLSLMNYDGTRPYVEVGVGVVEDHKGSTDVGPRVITIDFADPGSGVTRYVTGVCFEDLDGDLFYDPGEGLEGVRIESPASSFHTVSSASGGYALPVPANAGPITVTATGDAGGRSGVLGVQNAGVTLAGENVKLDFSPAPEAPPPARATFAGTPVALADGGTVEGMISVPAIDPDAPEVGDVDVSVTFAHPDASQLRVVLVSPAGTEVVLHDGGLPLANLTGEFDTTLACAGNLGTFAGEAYAGTWRLRVTDQATGGSRELSQWSLSVRPAWVRPLAFARSNLAVSTFKAKDVAAPGADSLRIAGTLDASGRALDENAPIHVRLLATDGAELGRWSVAERQSVGAVSVKLAYGLKGTSKTSFLLFLKKLDFAAPLPATVVVELAVGGAVVRETIPLVKGAFVGARTLPPAPFLLVESVKSTVSPKTGERTTTVKGHLAGVTAPVGGLVETFVGATQGKISADGLKSAGTRLTGKSSAALRSFVLDTRTGAFTVVVASQGDPLVDGRLPFSLRVGSVYAETETQPAVAGTTLRY